MKLRRNNISAWKAWLLASALLLLMASCAVNDVMVPDIDDQTSEIYFTGVVDSQEQISSRANNDIYDISASYYKCNFFINVLERKLEENSGLYEMRQKPGRYYIPSGSSGSLVPDFTQLPLNWFSRRTPHYFWGFSAPWIEDYGFTDEEKKTGKDFSAGIPLEFRDTHITEALTATPSVNNVSNWNEGSWRNGRILEQLLGGLTGPFNYVDNGSFVQLRFRHLVSKVYIKTFAVIDNVNGSVNSGLKGEMTIYGFPTQAKFFPCPQDDAGNPLQPYVEFDKNWNYDKDQSVTFAITNYKYTYESEGHTGNYDSNIFNDSFYFPPEVDFRNLTFKIEIYEYVNGGWRLSTSHGNHGAYYGDFSKISITRTNKGNTYDNPDDPDEIYKLHAGEYLALYINLYEKGEPSMRGVISSWNDFTGRNASQHVESGIYSLDELTELSTVMSSSADKDLRQEYYETHNGGTTASDPADLYPEYPEEKKVIKIYDDIGSTTAHNTSSSSTSNKMTTNLYVDEEYILDGQGHTVNLAYSYINLGPVRDIYFRYYSYSTSTNPYTYTEYIVYIDKKGNVYTVDPETFQETPTGENVNLMDKNPFSLNLSTGQLS